MNAWGNNLSVSGNGRALTAVVRVGCFQGVGGGWREGG